MGVRIVVGREQGQEYGLETTAVFIDSSTGWAFGPVFESERQAEAFLKWLRKDPRTMRDGELAAQASKFRYLTTDDSGEIRGDVLDTILYPKEESNDECQRD